MTQDNKDRLLGLLQQYKELGIAEQILAHTGYGRMEGTTSVG